MQLLTLIPSIEPHSTTSATPNTTSAATGGAATSSDPTTTSSTTTGPSTTSTTGHSTTAATEGSKAAEFAGNTGTAAESSKVPDNERTELKSKDTPSDTTSGQNDTRDPTNPQTNPKNNPTDVDDTEEGVNKGQKLDGPGPKPLNEVAKEHGGDAGASEKTATSTSEGKTENAAESDDPNDPHAPSKGEGTGEKYIKSSGMHADGGDFDAANAGAGREADREFSKAESCTNLLTNSTRQVSWRRRASTPQRTLPREMPLQMTRPLPALAARRRRRRAWHKRSRTSFTTTRSKGIKSIDGPTTNKPLRRHDIHTWLPQYDVTIG